MIFPFLGLVVELVVLELVESNQQPGQGWKGEVMVKAANMLSFQMLVLGMEEAVSCCGLLI